KSLVESYFKLDNIDVEQGFYRYFLNLYEYIAIPYREHARETITIQYQEGSDKTIFKIEDSISYTCRKVRDCIQNELKWNAEKDELKGMDSFRVKVTIPSDTFKSEIFRNNNPHLTEKESVFDCKKIDPEAKDPEFAPYYKGHGYTLNLKKYAGIDGLRIHVE